MRLLCSKYTKKICSWVMNLSGSLKRMGIFSRVKVMRFMAHFQQVTTQTGSDKGLGLKCRAGSIGGAGAAMAAPLLGIYKWRHLQA